MRDYLTPALIGALLLIAAIIAAGILGVATGAIAPCNASHDRLMLVPILPCLPGTALAARLGLPFGPMLAFGAVTGWMGYTALVLVIRGVRRARLRAPPPTPDDAPPKTW